MKSKKHKDWQKVKWNNESWIEFRSIHINLLHHWVQHADKFHNGKRTSKPKRWVLFEYLQKDKMNIAQNQGKGNQSKSDFPNWQHCREIKEQLIISISVKYPDKTRTKCTR